MVKRVARTWPLLVALAFLWLSLALIFHFSRSLNQGRLVYSLDDAYIHMALAKHLVQDGVWGVTRYGFSSSQSSLLWPLLLTLAYLPAGPNEIAPLVLNVVFSTLVVACLFLLLERRGLPAPFILLILFELIIFMRMPVMVFDGMEHLLQVLLVLAFVHFATHGLAGPGRISRGTALALALAPLLTATRYEGLFLIAVISPLFLLRRRWLPGLALPVLALAPVAAYAVISLVHGGYWLPNSLLMKSNWFNQESGVFAQLAHSTLVYLLAPAAAIYAYRLAKGHGFWRPEQLALLVLLVAFVPQVILGRLGPRYEAYLITLGLYGLATSVFALLRATRLPERTQARGALAMGVLLVLPIGLQGAQAVLLTPVATSNIYQQQYQMGRFLRQYYQGQAVAASDIGAIDYLADIRLLDLAGLGTVETAGAFLRGAFDDVFLRQLVRARRVKIAITYESIFGSGPPAAWVVVGKWRIPLNVVCYGDTVTFFAVDPSEAPRLRRHLLDFSHELPPQVKQVVFANP
jgi:hypothetical protein